MLRRNANNPIASMDGHHHAFAAKFMGLVGFAFGNTLDFRGVNAS
jgi:hypothetical protein